MPCDVLKKEIDNLYREALEDIQFLKKQQWQVVYYCLLLFSGLYFLIMFFVHDTTNPLIEYKRNFQIFFGAISILVCFFGLYFQVDFQYSLKKNRMYITYIRLSYPDWEVLALLDFHDKNKIKEYCSFKKDIKYFVAFISTTIVAFGFIFFLICDDLIWTTILTIIISAISSVWADC